MKLRTLGSWLTALLMTSLATVALAQNAGGPGPKGRGYGGPPKSEEERAARQQACPKPDADCPAVCPQGGAHGQGQGKGAGAGNGYRRGMRDGTGPRGGGNGNCPWGNAKPAAK